MRVFHHAVIMSRKYESRPIITVHHFHDVDDLIACLGVEVRRWLIGEHNRWPRHGARAMATLPLTAGEFIWTLANYRLNPPLRSGSKPVPIARCAKARLQEQREFHVLGNIEHATRLNV